MNLAFHPPKKDRCETCKRFRNLSPQEQEEEKVTYQQHRQSAEKIRAIKSDLKKEAAKSKLNAVFDLQKALPTPKSEVSLFYYARKLSTYNFSITDLTNDEITCFVWHEGVSARGSNEIGSCLLYMLQKWDKQGGIKEVNFFSNACPGQNRNWNILASLRSFLSFKSKNILKINHYFFESGHSQNENNAVHSVMERAAKRVEVFVPDQWCMLIKTSSKKQRCNVVELDNSLIYDVENIFQQTVAHKGSSKISKMQVMKNEGGNVFYKNSALEEDLSAVNARFTQITRLVIKAVNEEVGRVIAKKKKVDLLKLCMKLAIPKIYHNFYQKLKVHDDDQTEQDQTD